MQLLLVLLDEPNVLIMDEPGNDLDTDMLAVMEDLLDTWPGTLIVVSHDRYLLERVTDQQFALIGGKVRHLPGGVDDYLAMIEAAQLGGGAISPKPSKQSGSAGSGTAGSDGGAVSGGVMAGNSEKAESDGTENDDKLTGKAFHDATKRISAIERRLAKLEEGKADIESLMAAHDPSDFQGLNALNQELNGVQDETEALEAEWMELSEQVE
jgi:energy-coupling factor transporter ATP-binding protein EcfA2